MTTYYWTAYLRNKMVDYAFGKVAWTPASELFVGIATSVDDDGTVHGEPVGYGYTRVAINNTVGVFPLAALGSKMCAYNVMFPQATGPWGTPTVGFISDSLTGNTNTLLWGLISNSKAINLGDTIFFLPNSDITIGIA